MRKHRLPVSQEEQMLRDGRWLRHDDRRTPDGGAIGMRIDITDLKHREESFRLLFDANPMPMMVCDAVTLDIVAVNSAAVRLYGFPAEAMPQKRGYRFSQRQRGRAAGHHAARAGGRLRGPHRLASERGPMAANITS